MKMKREILMGIIVAVLLGVCIFIYSTNSSRVTLYAVAEGGVCKDITCMIGNFAGSCTPAKMAWTSESGNTILEIVGIVDGKFCEFKATSNGNTFRECYFPMSSLSENLAEQFFQGKDSGFGQLISDSCK